MSWKTAKRGGEMPTLEKLTVNSGLPGLLNFTASPRSVTAHSLPFSSVASDHAS